MKNPNFWKYQCLPMVSTFDGLTLPTLYWQTKIFLVFQVLLYCRLIFDGIWHRTFKFQKIIVVSSWLQIQVAVRLIFGGIWQWNFKLQKVIVVTSDFCIDKNVQGEYFRQPFICFSFICWILFFFILKIYIFYFSNRGLGPTFKFLRTYILKLGFLDGKEGYIISKMDARMIRTAIQHYNHLKKRG